MNRMSKTNDKDKSKGGNFENWMCTITLLIVITFAIVGMLVLFERCEEYEKAMEKANARVTIQETDSYYNREVFQEKDFIDFIEKSAISDEESSQIKKFFPKTENGSYVNIEEFHATVENLTNLENSFNDKGSLVYLEEVLDTKKEITFQEITMDFDVSKPCEMSKEEFITLITNLEYDVNGVMKETASLLWDLCCEYEVNPIFIEGIIAVETGWGKAIPGNNLFGYAISKDGQVLNKFESKEECLKLVIKAIRTNYLNEDGGYYTGGITIKNVNFYYNPKHDDYCIFSQDPMDIPPETTWRDCHCNFNYEWSREVANCMNMILNSAYTSNY